MFGTTGTVRTCLTIPCAALALLACAHLACAATADEELFAAVAKGEIRNVEKAVKAGADVNARDGTVNEGKTALMRAAAGGSRKIVSLLISRGARVNDRSRDTTALIEAVKAKDRDMVSLLIRKGADINVTGNGDRKDPSTGRVMSALQAAAEANAREIVELLLSRQAEDDASYELLLNDPAYFKALAARFPRMKKEAALTEAVARKDLELVRFLLDKGADAGAGTIAAEAAAEGDVAILRLLVARGADVNTSEWEGGDRSGLSGITPLMEAARRGDREMVKALIECGADVNAAAGSGASPVPVIDFAATEEIRAILLEAGSKDPGKRVSTATLEWWDGDPATGASSQSSGPQKRGATYAFTVVYLDVEDVSPGIGFPVVHVTKGGAEIQGSPFPMTPLDVYLQDTLTYADGIRYRCSVSLPKGLYRYYFEAVDRYGGKASGDPAKERGLQVR